MSANYLNQAINGSIRIAFVIAPTVKAGSHLLELATRTLNAALQLIGLELKMPAKLPADANEQQRKDATFASKVYTYVHNYLPASITSQNDAFKNLSNRDVATGFAFYTGVAIVSTFAANKFIGPTPEVYNSFAKYAGSSLRIDTSYDIIQMLINRVTGK